MQNYKVLVTRKWPSSVEKKLKESFDVTLNESDIPLTEDQLLEGMNNYDAVLPTVTDSISNKVISSSPFIIFCELARLFSTAL